MMMTVRRAERPPSVLIGSNDYLKFSRGVLGSYITPNPLCLGDMSRRRSSRVPDLLAAFVACRRCRAAYGYSQHIEGSQDKGSFGTLDTSSIPCSHMFCNALGPPMKGREMMHQHT